MFSGEGKYERMNGGTQVEKIGKGQYHLKKKKKTQVQSRSCKWFSPAGTWGCVEEMRLET